jgi:DNA-binding PadR family transcriptional regulator
MKNYYLSKEAFHILLAVSKDPMHGYQITKVVFEETEGRYDLPPGTMYGALKRLLEDGMVELMPTPVLEDSRRKYYKATKLGVSSLKSEVAKMQDSILVAKKYQFIN